MGEMFKGEKGKRFGSEWQEAKLKQIDDKLKRGIELTDEENVFLAVLAWHNEKGVRRVS